MRNTASSDDIQSGISDSDKSVKTPLGKKILATFGILFIAIGVFLAAFGLSYRLIMLPKTTTVPKDNAEAEIIRLNTQINQLETENRKLKEENEILKGGSASSNDSTSGSSGSNSTKSSKNSSSSGSSSSSSSSGTSSSTKSSGSSSSSKSSGSSS